MLGNKALECFTYSALYDDDAEFLRRYGEPDRAAWMGRYYASEDKATHALARLKLLTK